jgi:signal peptidase I
MATNPTTDKVKTGDSDTRTEAKPFSFSRLFNRNGHDEQKAPPVRPVGPPKTWVREYFESAVVTVIMALFGMTFIVQAVKVPTGSMQNTITIGDHLLVNKFIFAPGQSLPFLPQREIRRGDIIVFKYPGNPLKDADPYNPSDRSPENRPLFTNYVKRVIGIPGDRIRLEGQDVIVNGQVIPEHRIEATDNGNQKAPLTVLNSPERKADEPYSVYYKTDDNNQPRFFDLFEHENEITVPEDKYFVMGDNRYDSQDSRYWGYVPRDLVIGRAMFVYWSYDESAPTTGYGVFADFFVNTRWSRTGTLIK